VARARDRLGERGTVAAPRPGTGAVTVDRTFIPHAVGIVMAVRVAAHAARQHDHDDNASPHHLHLGQHGTCPR
jgi:hypothetical protein